MWCSTVFACSEFWTLCGEECLPMNPKVKGCIKRIFFVRPAFAAYELLSWSLHRRTVEDQWGQLRLHLGAGDTILDGWLNIDVHPGRHLLTMKLPESLKRFADHTVQYIYASHFLEHLGYPEQALEFAHHCQRILVPGGVLRVVVPDIECIIRAYAADDGEFFKVQASMHPRWCSTKLEHLIYALQQDGEHRYGYDFETLKKLLSQVGFQQIEKSGFNQSHTRELNVDYRAESTGAGQYLSLFVDAHKSL